MKGPKNIDKDHRERELPDLYMKKKKGFPEIKDTTKNIEKGKREEERESLRYKEPSFL